MPEEDSEEQSSARPFWSGTISFGLVSVPVELYPANRSSRVSLRMLAPDGTPLRRRYFSARTGKELAPEDMTRGYELEPGQYVEVTDEELEKLAPEKSRDIDLRRFVSIDEIPPLHFERGYFLAPASDSTKAYQLLAAVMEKTARAGIATFVMRGKEYLIAIIAENGILRAETMRFKDEIRTPEYIGLPEKSQPTEDLVRHFEQLISKHAAEELPRDELHDETAAALLKLVRAKQARKEDLVTSPEKEEEGPGQTEGLAALLKKSLSGSRRGAPREKHPVPRASARRRTRESSESKPPHGSRRKSKS